MPCVGWIDRDSQCEMPLLGQGTGLTQSVPVHTTHFSLGNSRVLFFRRFRIAITSLALMLPAITWAQQSLDRSWCSEPNSTNDQRIAGCTTLILSGRESKDDLALEFYNRAYAHHAKGNYDDAIADYDQAKRLNPKDAPTYNNRGNAYSKKGDYEHAIADYEQAIGLNPKDPSPYNNRGNARAKNKDRDGAIADYTRAIELKPDYATAYYNRAMMKKEKGDAAGADADFKQAQKLNPDLLSEGSAPASSSAANEGATGTTVSLLDGKLKLDIASEFSRDADDPKSPKTVAKFSGPDGAWGEVLRGTHGLTPDKLDGYLKMRVAEYSKGFNWLPKDSQLRWLKKDIVTIDGRKWADWRYVPMLKGTKDYSHSPVYTRFLTTSYKGQLLEITFTSNLNTAPGLKQKIDHIMDSVHLEE